MRPAYMNDYPSLYRGKVEDNKDPMKLGRCRVRVPAVHGALLYPVDTLPWARPLVLSPVGEGRGSVQLPDVGDIVWVFFEGSNRDCPVYLGGTYSSVDKLDISNDIIDFYLEGDSKISYNRVDRLYTIKIGSVELKVSPEKVTVIGDMEIEGSLSVSKDLHVEGDVYLNAAHGDVFNY